jgi:microcin C transport system ATP-binding protein
MLDQVGLNEDLLKRYPGEVSGGEKQRIVIARIMALRPRFVVLDEPTSMLDVSVQANILHLLMGLQQARNMAYLYISHDMRLVSMLCQRVAVVVEGRIVEQGTVSEITARPRHACTKRLIATSGL